MRGPIIKRGPASQHASQGEAIYEFSDGTSGGLIALKRVNGRLVVDVYRLDGDVVVRAPRESVRLPGQDLT